MCSARGGFNTSPPSHCSSGSCPKPARHSRPLLAFMHGDTFVGVSWLSQSFLQLVLLPIILVGQNVISVSQDARAEADHETLTALHTMNVRQLQLLEQEKKILDILQHRSA